MLFNSYILIIIFFSHWCSFLEIKKDKMSLKDNNHRSFYILPKENQYSHIIILTKKFKPMQHHFFLLNENNFNCVHYTPSFYPYFFIYSNKIIEQPLPQPASYCPNRYIKTPLGLAAYLGTFTVNNSHICPQGQWCN